MTDIWAKTSSSICQSLFTVHSVQVSREKDAFQQISINRYLKKKKIAKTSSDDSQWSHSTLHRFSVSFSLHVDCLLARSAETRLVNTSRTTNRNQSASNDRFFIRVCSYAEAATLLQHWKQQTGADRWCCGPRVKVSPV